MLNQATLRAKIRTSYLNEDTAGFWADSELNAWLDEAILEYQRKTKCYVKTVEINSTDYTSISDLFQQKRLRDQTTGEIQKPFKTDQDATNVKLIWPIGTYDLEYYAANNAKDGSNNYTYSDNIDEIAIIYYVCREAHNKERNQERIGYYAQMWAQRTAEMAYRNRRV